ncbi:glutamate--cysteine ligase [Amycolatopsis rhabdoformis]|uniref:Putative glutamate--cysteine ligase 2 n=1 Tax=Amycolatopsis rhabdoformis TaxID=1448059 RepID=A0ABZ1IJ32_9PSEU|nr:glutamate--cysteine ligase [Amycolatopsis rhabdoformis]WSE34297.1 glutamate--cysteine ligase [Amycolatopsis rhabdoformis]
MRTFGIEEEFLVVDDQGRPAHAAGAVLDSADDSTPGDLQHELTRSQAETATGICETPAEAIEQLRAMRASLADAAGRRGLRILPCAAPPVASTDLPAITPHPRYERMAAHFGATARTTLTCGCHVHVAIPDAETATRVLGHVRPWLPALLTITANSAIADGLDTGYASWRQQQWTRWPSAGPPPRFASHADYEGVVDAWLRAGAILDRGMVYWDVRLSDEQPTIEFRVADVAATPEEATLLAVLCRALVTTVLDAGEPPHLSNEVLRGRLWRAAREGVTGHCPDPTTGDPRPTAEVLARLAAFCGPALTATGDTALVETGLARLTHDGGGADRQRRLFTTRCRATDVVDHFAVCPGGTRPAT